MATAVVQLELNSRRNDLLVPGSYARALVLLRWAGRPVGQLVLPVTGGRIALAVVQDALTRSATWNVWAAWLHDSLGWDEAETRSPAPRATVAVCTRNRPLDLSRSLEAIAALPDDGQDVIVVDNNSSDGSTADVVARWPKARYIRHADGGLNAARNRAVREARQPIVAFTDDDAFVDPGWLRALTRDFENPLVLCATGLTMPVELETEAQELFERYSPFSRSFRRRVFDGASMNPMAVGPVGAGANMAVCRRSRGRSPANATRDRRTCGCCPSTRTFVACCRSALSNDTPLAQNRDFVAWSSNDRRRPAWLPLSWRNRCAHSRPPGFGAGG
jgi:hypothetical protein